MPGTGPLLPRRPGCGRYSKLCLLLNRADPCRWSSLLRGAEGPTGVVPGPCFLAGGIHVDAHNTDFVNQKPRTLAPRGGSRLHSQPGRSGWGRDGPISRSAWSGSFLRIMTIRTADSNLAGAHAPTSPTPPRRGRTYTAPCSQRLAVSRSRIRQHLLHDICTRTNLSGVSWPSRSSTPVCAIDAPPVRERRPRFGRPG